MTKTYTLKPEDSRRVAEALASGEVDEVKAVAVDEGGEPVQILVKDGDDLRLVIAGVEVAEVEGEEAARTLPPGAGLRLEQVEGGGTMLVTGLILFTSGWIVSGVPGLVLGSWPEAIPLGGPIYGGVMSAVANAFCGWGSEDGDSDCGGSSPWAVAYALSFLMQATGLGLTIAGGVIRGWDREVYRAPGREWPKEERKEREDTGEGSLGVTLGFEPVVTPDGAVGGVLTGRF
ncbi:MAG TPA: hypothetical protein P5076_11525 [Myxococcota bacterium]|nr:hypothetical protein [Myxococcota bacterium]